MCLPSSNAMLSIELQNGCGEESTEGVANLLCNVETGETLSKLFLCIPGRQVVDCT